MQHVVWCKKLAANQRENILLTVKKAVSLSSTWSGRKWIPMFIQVSDRIISEWLMISGSCVMQQNNDSNNHTHLHTYMSNSKSPKNVSCMSLDWEEAVPGENLHRHRENMQTPPSWSSGANPQPSYCEETLPATVPPIAHWCCGKTKDTICPRAKTFHWLFDRKP